MLDLLSEIRTCRICELFLPNKPQPVVQAGVMSRIAIIGQAPGQKVQQSGIPWDDQSGRELRRWLGVTEDQFYDDALFALVPMGFCYPGKGASGDMPPRKECAPQWHAKLFAQMSNIRLILLVGQYAQKFYLANSSKISVTENTRYFRRFLPDYLPLVHPSPRNKIWQKRNPWFESEVVPELRIIVRESLRYDNSSYKC